MLAARKLRAGMPGVYSQGMVKEGYTFGLPLLVLGGVFYLLQWNVAAVVLVFLACLFFLSFAIRSA